MEGENKDLDFSLPTDENKSKKCIFSSSSPLNLILLAAIFAACLITMIAVLSASIGNGESSNSNTNTDIIKTVAAKLEDRKIYETSADKWVEYIKNENLSSSDKAKYAYRIAKNYFEAGKYNKALEYLYISENTKEIEEYKNEISRMKLDSFRRLGNLAGLNAELSKSTNLNDKSSNDEVVIAEIGPDKLTKSDVDKIIEDQIDTQLIQYASFMDEEQLMKQKEEMQKMFESEDARNRVIQEWLGQELLKREAIEQGIENDPKLQRQFENIRRSFLASQYINKIIKEQIKISESDLKDYYSSHKNEFINKAKANLSRIIADSKEKAESAITDIKGGLSFPEAVKKYSIDNSTMDNDGKLSQAVEKGKAIQGLGDDAKILTKIFALKDGEISEPIMAEDGMYHIYKMDSFEEEKMLSYDEAKKDIASKKTNAKREELIKATIEELKNKYKVIIHSNINEAKKDK